jgi:hypothetical protein
LQNCARKSKANIGHFIGLFWRRLGNKGKDAGMSDLARWVFGRDEDDLPVMQRSEMIFPYPMPA